MLKQEPVKWLGINKDTAFPIQRLMENYLGLDFTWMGDPLVTPGAIGMGLHMDAAKSQVDSVENSPLGCFVPVSGSVFKEHSQQQGGQKLGIT